MNRPHVGTLGACARLMTLVISLCAIAHLAKADASKHSGSGLPSAVLLATGGAPSGGEALDSVILAGLEELGVVQITARPGMDLGALQLALDCVAETPQCLRSVTTQSGALVLVAPTVQRTSSELILNLLRFDARGDGELRRVLRRFPGKTLGAAALDAVPSMLRELFGLPANEKKAAPPPAAETKPAPLKPAPLEPPAPLPLPEGPMEPAASRAVPVGPLVLAGVGVLVIGGGIVAGLMKQSSEDKFNKLPQPRTEPEARSANDLKSTGQTEATLSNVFFGVGGAAVAAGAIWLVVELSQKPRAEYEPVTSLRPTFGPHQLGLVLSHHGAGL
jgi:hypothetical protein